MISRSTLLAIALVSITTPTFGQDIVGWRTDGSGRYPKADPPTVWGLDKNVVWKTPLSKFSVATPVIVGDKIFTCVEPTTLVCINKADGKILWEKSSTRAEIPWSDADKEKLAAEREQDAVWGKKQRE